MSMCLSRMFASSSKLWNSSVTGIQNSFRFTQVDIWRLTKNPKRSVTVSLLCW